MDSIVVYTEEIDEPREAAAELLVQTWEFPLKKHSLALIFSEEDSSSMKISDSLDDDDFMYNQTLAKVMGL